MEIGVLFLFAVWLSFLSYIVYGMKKHYERLVKGTDGKTLTAILEHVFAELARFDEDKTKLKHVVEDVIQESEHHVQKVGLIRFNPFANTGGDQSFILTLLDGENNGIILTSLHSRGMTRWYAKNVAKGKGVDHELSNEEERAIKESVTVGKNRMRKRE